MRDEGCSSSVIGISIYQKDKVEELILRGNVNEKEGGAALKLFVR